MNYKQQAAIKALDYVQDGMILGLGSGSTMAYFIQCLGEGCQAGLYPHLQAVPSSDSTAAQARSLGIRLTSLADHPRLDLAVDGADEVDPRLNLIKGLGKALLREKIVVVHAHQFVVIVDESKIVPRLGSRCPLPVEILPYEWQAHIRWLNTLGCRAELWRNPDGSAAVTDNGNYLALCWFNGQSVTPIVGDTANQGIPDVYALSYQLAARPGIIEHGLFLDMASQVIIAGPHGIRILERIT